MTFSSGIHISSKCPAEENSRPKEREYIPDEEYFEGIEVYLYTLGRQIRFFNADI